jgi:hypothetical protein
MKIETLTFLFIHFPQPPTRAFIIAAANHIFTASCWKARFCLASSSTALNPHPHKIKLWINYVLITWISVQHRRHTFDINETSWGHSSPCCWLKQSSCNEVDRGRSPDYPPHLARSHHPWFMAPRRLLLFIQLSLMQFLTTLC